jgi:hypothetical protein
MNNAGRSAEEVYSESAICAASARGKIVPVGYSSPFVCPYCGVNSQHDWGHVATLSIYPSVGTQDARNYQGDGVLCAARCQTCGGEAIFLGGKVIVPNYSPAPLPSEDMPLDLVADYMEARDILQRSPRGSAALLRLVIQKLCPILGATKSDINNAIGELLSSGKINIMLQQALDTVRVVGNEAVHPGTIDLRDDVGTATSLFELINIIIEKAITEPRKIERLYNNLPGNKLSGIENRDR